MTSLSVAFIFLLLLGLIGLYAIGSLIISLMRKMDKNPDDGKDLTNFPD